MPALTPIENLKYCTVSGTVNVTSASFIDSAGEQIGDPFSGTITSAALKSWADIAGLSGIPEGNNGGAVAVEFTISGAVKYTRKKDDGQYTSLATVQSDGNDLAAGSWRVGVPAS